MTIKHTWLWSGVTVWVRNLAVYKADGPTGLQRKIQGPCISHVWDLFPSGDLGDVPDFQVTGDEFKESVASAATALKAKQRKFLEKL